jgi:hypothetical protein
MVIAQGGMFTITIHDFTVPAPGIIEAAPGGKPVLQVESAALQVPTAGLVWFFTFGTPQMKEALLHHVSLHRWIGS